MARQRFSGAALALTTALSIVACSKSESNASDTGQAMSGAASGPADTAMGSMAGMDRSAMTSTPAKDADQEFVRMMVDHHQGMIVLADTALARNPSAQVRTDAREMRQKQLAEQKKMIDMLKRDYAEDKMPMVMASNARMISDVSSKTGADLDRTFRSNVIAHHEEALKMVRDFEPRFTKPAVRTMATKMKADQTKEIAKLKAEMK